MWPFPWLGAELWRLLLWRAPREARESILINIKNENFLLKSLYRQNWSNHLSYVTFSRRIEPSFWYLYNDLSNSEKNLIFFSKPGWFVPNFYPGSSSGQAEFRQKISTWNILQSTRVSIPKKLGVKIRVSLHLRKWPREILNPKTSPSFAGFLTLHKKMTWWEMKMVKLLRNLKLKLEEESETRKL